jgi:hypothetical protein
MRSVESTVAENQECREALGKWKLEELELDKECWVTCPVRDCHSLRHSLVYGARGAGFCPERIITEPYAAGHNVIKSGKIQEKDAALVVLDFGGVDHCTNTAYPLRWRYIHISSRMLPHFTLSRRMPTGIPA